MCFLGTECIPGLLEGILLSTCWLSHCFWLEQDLDICLKASDQNNRRVSVALKKFSLHICNWDLLTHMLNLCYKQRNKFWPKGSSLGILQGQRLNTASQAALKDLFCIKYCSPSEKIKPGSNWNVRTTIILKMEHLRRPIQLLGFGLEMLTTLYHRTSKMTQLQLILQLLWYSSPVVYSVLQSNQSISHFLAKN